MQTDTSFELFGTLMFSWAFFKIHTGFGIPILNLDFDDNGLVKRRGAATGFSIQPWLLLVPIQYRDEILDHLGGWSLGVKKKDVNVSAFQRDIYDAFLELAKGKIQSGEWPRRFGGSEC